MLLAAAVAEGTLTSLGGGGFLIVWQPDSAPVVLDCFVRQPGRGLDRPLAPWDAYSLQLESTVLSFGIGPASVAVPVLPAGIGAASSRFGRITLEAAAEPALAMATDGVVLTEAQAAEHALNLGMVTRHPQGAEIFLTAEGRPHQVGDILRQPALARAIELIAATGGQSFYDGELAQSLLDWSDSTGARITREDLAAAAVIDRDPLRFDVGSATVLATPSPSMGGRITEALLRRFCDESSLNARQFPGDDARIATILRHTFDELQPPATVPPKPGESVVHHELRDEPLATSPGTTHVSAIDADGMMASATCSVGFGSGEYLDGFGIQLNNMLAEYGHDQARPPGVATPSMMTPMLLLGDTTSVALGSAGANRIPQALSQIIVRLLAGVPLDEAIHAPRFIWDGTLMHAEPGHDDASMDWLRSEMQLEEWAVNDAYFGTSNGAAIRSGRLFATGDARRDARGIVVD
jgi:gamma-glutamyltranspeptidase/glutathione hydrolase